jgi:hypothetical protein
MGVRGLNLPNIDTLSKVLNFGRETRVEIGCKAKAPYPVIVCCETD